MFASFSLHCFASLLVFVSCASLFVGVFILTNRFSVSISHRPPIPSPMEEFIIPLKPEDLAQPSVREDEYRVEHQVHPELLKEKDIHKLLDGTIQPLDKDP